MQKPGDNVKVGQDGRQCGSEVCSVMESEPLLRLALDDELPTVDGGAAFVLTQDAVVEVSNDALIGEFRL